MNSTEANIEYTTTHKIMHNGKQYDVECNLYTGEVIRIFTGMVKYELFLSKFLASNEGVSLMQTINSLNSLNLSTRRNMLTGGERVSDINVQLKSK